MTGSRPRARRLSRWLGGRLPGAAARRIQVVAFAAGWDEANTAALAAGGRLWVALGDSTAQGIGATSRERGYVGQLLALLRRRDPSWQVLNLARTGATTADVLAQQVPCLAALPQATLVTCGAGTNDLLHHRPLEPLRRSLVALLLALPAGTVVATLPQGVRPGLASALNATLQSQAEAGGLVVADVWARTGPPWHDKFSADHFHPNDDGYADWAAAFAEALGLA